MSRVIAVALATATAAGGCVGGSATPAQAIAHGTDAADDTYRFSVKLVMTGIPTPGHGRRDSSCSGALIAPRWVITAGHCFRAADGTRAGHTVARRTTAVVGRTYLSRPAGHQITVIDVRQSPTGDVALAELGAAVTDVAPLRVATTPPAVGDVVRLTGYGSVSDNGGPATRLQTGTFTVSAVDDATIAVTGLAPRADTSACPHDSGGPYFLRRNGTPTLVAVVSRGPACPHTGADLGARTDDLAGWIAATVSGEPSGPSVLPGPATLGALFVTILGTVVMSVRGWRAAPRRGRLAQSDPRRRHGNG